MPPVRSTKPVRKPKNAAKTIKRVLKYLLDYKILLVFVAFGIIFSSIAAIAGNFLLKPVINNLTTSRDMAKLIRTLILMGVFYTWYCWNIHLQSPYAYHCIWHTQKNKNRAFFTSSVAFYKIF